MKERNHSTHIDSESLTLANVAPIEQLSDAAEVKEAAVEAAMLNRPSHLTEFSHVPISNHDLLPPILPNPNNTVILPTSFIEPNSFASGQTDSAESEHVSRPKKLVLFGILPWFHVGSYFTYTRVGVQFSCRR